MEGVAKKLLYQATLSESPVFKGTFFNRKTSQAVHQVMSKKCVNFMNQTRSERYINLTEIFLI